MFLNNCGQGAPPPFFSPPPQNGSGGVQTPPPPAGRGLILLICVLYSSETQHVCIRWVSEDLHWIFDNLRGWVSVLKRPAHPQNPNSPSLGQSPGCVPIDDKILDTYLSLHLHWMDWLVPMFSTSTSTGSLPCALPPTDQHKDQFKMAFTALAGVRRFPLNKAADCPDVTYFELFCTYYGQN